MGSVLVARRHILFSKAYGSANLEWNIPNTTTTRFRIASVTRQFTAAAVLLLEERGKIRTDEPVKTYHPDAPAAWDKITLFHLLTHTSGIPNYTTLPEAVMQFDLNEPERNATRHALEIYVSELRAEIVKTEKHEWRIALQKEKEKEILEHVIEQLGVPARLESS